MLRARLQLIGHQELKALRWCQVMGCQGQGWLQYHVVTYDFTPIRPGASDRAEHVWLCQGHGAGVRQVWAERRGGAVLVHDQLSEVQDLPLGARVFYP